jgi:hypothetical protein
VLVSGTKACQEDYDFASQANVAGTGTAVSSLTATPSSSPTITPTGSITPADTGTVTPTPSDVADDEGEETGQAGAGDDLFNELSALSEGKSGGSVAAAGAAGAVISAGGAAKSENWLGAAFSKDPEDTWRDSDGDGFSDAMEEANQSDPRNSASAPKLEGATRLEDRVRQQEVEQEADRLGDESRSASEGEGESDSDGDGIPDVVEVQRGTNPNAGDSDQDGLRDDREIVLGTNPLKVDSDADGISDMREYISGTDPTITDGK